MHVARSDIPDDGSINGSLSSWPGGSGVAGSMADLVIFMGLFFFRIRFLGSVLVPTNAPS